MRAEAQQYEDTMDRMSAVLTPRQQAQVRPLLHDFLVADISSLFSFLFHPPFFPSPATVLSTSGVPARSSHPVEERLGEPQGEPSRQPSHHELLPRSQRFPQQWCHRLHLLKRGWPSPYGWTQSQPSKERIYLFIYLFIHHAVYCT